VGGLFQKLQPIINMENNINDVTSPTLKKKSKSKKWFWILGIVLVLALGCAFGYIGYDKYSDYRYEQDEKLYQEGAYFGYNSAVIQIVEQVNTCKSIPLNYVDDTGNQTINILKLECLSNKQLECLYNG